MGNHYHLFIETPEPNPVSGMPEEFDLEWLPAFKRDVYRQVMRDFFRIEL